MLLTKSMIKGARGLIEWSAVDLASNSGVSIDTIRSFESGRTISMTAVNQETIRSAFTAAGIQFLENGDLSHGAGVALKTAEVGG